MVHSPTFYVYHHWPKKLQTFMWEKSNSPVDLMGNELLHTFLFPYVAALWASIFREISLSAQICPFSDSTLVRESQGGCQSNRVRGVWFYRSVMIYVGLRRDTFCQWRSCTLGNRCDVTTACFCRHEVSILNMATLPMVVYLLMTQIMMISHLVLGNDSWVLITGWPEGC